MNSSGGIPGAMKANNTRNTISHGEMRNVGARFMFQREQENLPRNRRFGMNELLRMMRRQNRERNMVHNQRTTAQGSKSRADIMIEVGDFIARINNIEFNNVENFLVCVKGFANTVFNGRYANAPENKPKLDMMALEWRLDYPDVKPADFLTDIVSYIEQQEYYVKRFGV